jgi:nucleotide-binding universal stress UspA family protein
MSGVPRLFARILVPTDFSPQSSRAWETARRLAGALGADLFLVHVLVEAPLFSEGPFAGERVREVIDSMRVWVDKSLEQWAAQARAEGLAVTTQRRTGEPYREVLAAAEEFRAELIVIGTHGRGGLDRALLGSVADRVIRVATCPVLTVRESD